jgi:hypothetical protein
MLLASIFSLETIFVMLCLLGLTWGLVRITMRRQSEILKEYLQPDHLKVEQLVMRSGKTLPNHEETEPLPDSQDTPPQE